MMNRLMTFIVFITLLITNTASAETKKISIPGKTPPTMMAFEVLSEAYKKIGISLEYSVLPGERSLVNANDGITIGEAARIKGIEKNYPNLIMVPVPVSNIDWVAVASDRNIQINGWDSLKPYKIGIRQGIKLTEIRTKGMKVQKTGEYWQALKKVKSGRSDVAVMPKLSAVAEIKDNSITGLTILEPPLETTFLYHYIHKSNQAILEQLTAELKQMESSGEIRDIQNAVMRSN